jgi:hypothetical protein
MKTLPHDLRAVAGQFAIVGDYLAAEPYGSGHINDTYASIFDQGGTRVRYIHQRINANVFKQPALVMENVERVLRHVHAKLTAAGVAERHRRCLTLIPTRSGAAFYRDPRGNYWRTYVFIEKAATYDVIASPAMARAAARAFGRFQQLLADLPAPRLHDTIPDFHHTPRRFAVLEQALARDAANRAARAKAEIDFALQRRTLTQTLIRDYEQGLIPERIAHNDTKLNNVMIDDATQEGICVIDLDTVMPGLAHYDFGDMVRTATRSGAEDEPDLSRIVFQADMFDALAQGYLETAGGFLTPAETDRLAVSGPLITFEIGIRFLADYLVGDVYFKTHRPDHNLDRCRTQFKMVAEMERCRDAMEAMVRRHAGSGS